MLRRHRRHRFFSSPGRGPGRGRTATTPDALDADLDALTTPAGRQDRGCSDDIGNPSQFVASYRRHRAALVLLSDKG